MQTASTRDLILAWRVFSGIRCPSFSTCSQFQRAQPKEPMVILELPDRLWAKIGSDLFEFNGAHYLLSADYYSKWIEIAKLSNLNSKNGICHLKSQFAKYGIPMNLSLTWT